MGRRDARWGLPLAASAAAAVAAAVAAPIDRRAVVQRHNLAISAATGAALSPYDVLSLGNGDFAFNVDATGAQSLNATYAANFDLNTLSSWQFHTIPFAPGAPREALETFNFSVYTTPVSDAANRSVPYATNQNISKAAYGWIHSNPHRLNLAQVAVVDCAGAAAGGGGGGCAPLSAGDLTSLNRTLDLWGGLHAASFTLPGGRGVTTATAVHPDLDMLALRVGGGAGVGLRLAFPYATGAWGPSPSEWGSQYDAAHTTTVAPAAGGAAFARTLDSDGYSVLCAWSDPSWALARTGPHAFELRPPPAGGGGGGGGGVDLVCLFAPRGVAYPVGASAPWLQAKAASTAALLAGGPSALPGFDAVVAASAGGWAAFWGAGAFVDLTGGASPPDPVAVELERRVVLSLYLTRAHSAGASPPQETGLLCNSWSGKRHSEMRFWHQGHWPLWMRGDLLARSDGALADELPNATAYATMQGYDGARWPKMVAEVANRSGIDVPWLGERCATCGGGGGGGGNLLLWESVNTINPVLVWHQPSPILLGELQRRAANASGGHDAALAVMTRLWPVVEATARFQASFLYWSDARGGYSMGPPLMGGEEEGSFTAVENPSFELTAFAVTLDAASEWAAVLTGARNATWDAVARGVAPRAVDAGSPPGMPLYAINAAAGCCFLRGGFNDPECPPAAAAELRQCDPTNSHPLVVGQLGMLNGAPAGEPGRFGLEVGVLNNTLRAVAEPGAGAGPGGWGNWSWGSPTSGANVWGWDWGLTALAMTRLGWDPAVIAAFLASDFQKNSYLPNGVNFQADPQHGGGDNLPAYLPGNGALLLAVGALAAGTETSPPAHFPPAWGARVEGFGFAYP